MFKTRKLNRLAESDNVKLLDELCYWIDANINDPIGLNELVNKTNLKNSDLQYLFERYKQTTPMTYIRNKRESHFKNFKSISFIHTQRIYSNYKS
jgi:transcriptional regulator GlxA family with amidase domain